jgi:hypothetical protein
MRHLRDFRSSAIFEFFNTIRQKRSFQNCHRENSISALSDLAASSNPHDLLMNETIPTGDIFRGLTYLDRKIYLLEGNELFIAGMFHVRRAGRSIATLPATAPCG